MIKRFIKKNKGFTLIELLVVIAMIGIVASIALNIFTSTLRGGSKTTSIDNIRQNGNYVISQMSKMIAYAKEFEGVCNKVGTVTCTDISQFSTNCSVAANTYTHILIKNFDLGETIFSCNSASDTPASTIASRSATLTSGGDSLIDTSNIIVSSCKFYCVRSSPVISPTITISFTLQSNGIVAEKNNSIDFETSVVPRNNPQNP